VHIPDLSHARWRVSSGSNGANTCVQAAAVGDVVAVQNSNQPSPMGPVLTVPQHEWEHFLADVLTNDVRQAKSCPLGPFQAATTASGDVHLRLTDARPVEFTAAEWDIFTNSVHNGEFTLNWLSVQADSSWRQGADEGTENLP
jgi:hypothetical protein